MKYHFMSQLGDALFTTTQQKVLGLLYSQPEKSFYTNEIRSALTPLSEKIVWSFIFGSVARSKETSTSDIDLLIIGDVSFAKVVELLYTTQKSLGREINPKIYSMKEWEQMLNNKDAFAKEVLEKPRIDVLGDGHEFR